MVLCEIEYSLGFATTLSSNLSPSSSFTSRSHPSLSLSLSSNRESRVHRFVIVFFPDWLRPNWITRSIIQRRLTDQLSDCVVRACCNRKQQPKPRPHLRPSPLLRSSPRYLLVHPLHPRDLVIPSFESILTNL